MLFEPLTDGGQLDEAQEIQVKFFVTGANAAVAFGALKEVFDLVPVAVTATIPPRGFAPTAS